MTNKPNPKSKLTVEDFIRIYESYCAVRIEIQPGKFETLNFDVFDITDIIKIMPIQNETQMYNNFEETLDSSFPRKIFSKNNIDEMIKHLLEKNVIAIITHDEYDEETLEAFKLYKKLEEK